MSQTSRFLSWLGVGLFLAGGSIAFGDAPKNDAYTCQSPEVQACVRDLGADCNPGGRTAISKLPGARVIVFDPISRSFLFTTCSNSTQNEEILDRRRLALSTQKLRLLVLPYNPADGDLQIETVAGTGTEFASISSTGTTSTTSNSSATTPPATSPTPGQAASKPTDQPPPQNAPSLSPDLKSKVRMQGQRLANAKKKGKNAVPAETNPATDFLMTGFQAEHAPGPLTQWAARLRQAGAPITPDNVLTVISGLFDSFDSSIRASRSVLSGFSDGTECMDRHLDDMSSSLGAELAKSGSWSPARDQRLCAVIAEAFNRQEIIARDFYQPCTKPGGQVTASFENDVQSLNAAKNDASSQLGTLDQLLAEIGRYIDIMKALSPDPTDANLTSQWKGQADAFSGQLAADQKYLSDLNTQLAATIKTFDGARQKRGQFRAGQGSQASQLHRENYPPLANESSITFKVSRVTDGAKSSQPIAQLEVRSAPTYNMRFGTGLVVSQLKDPTFKLGPVAASPSTNTSSQTSQTNQTPASPPPQKIQFDDEGGGHVLPMIMVHHYWGRRSPLLSPTLFEKLMPTFSLGIPVAKADPLTQVLFGLDWELTPGVELNAGVHYGKVNSLIGGYTIGAPLDGIDLSSIQKKTFSSALYFGIVVNGDTFKTLMDSQK